LQSIFSKMRASNEKAGLSGDGDDDKQPTTAAPLDEGMSSDEEGGADLDAGEARLKTRHGDDNEYEGEDDDKQEVEPEDQPVGAIFPILYSRTRISAQYVYQLFEHTPPRKEATQFCVVSFHVGVCSNN
jgi:hypothetical protein